MSAAEGQQIAALTLDCLKCLRSDEQFTLFWQRVTAEAQERDIEEPILPRRRKVPRRIDDGSPGTFPNKVEDHYRPLYLEALDLITNCITRRFDQPGYQSYSKVEALLLKTATGQACEQELDFVKSFYGSDFDADQLTTHLEIFAKSFQQKNQGTGSVAVTNIIDHFSSLPKAHRELMSQAGQLLQLLLVMPATNACSERAFSAVRRVKTYLRSTMTQLRLNSLMLLHVHKELTDSVSLIDIDNDFITGSDHRREVFGQAFKPSDV